MLRSRGGSAGLPTHGGGGSFSSHGSNHSSSQYMSSPTQHSHDGGGGYGGNHRSSRSSRSSFVSRGGSSNDRLLQVLSVIFLLVGISCTWSYRSYQQWPPQMEALLLEKVKKTGSSSSSSSSWDQLKESHEDLMELIRESKWEWRKKQNSLTKEKRQQVKDLEAKLAELKKDRDALQEKYKGGHRQLEQKKHIQKRESGFQDLMETLQLAIRKESKRTVLERFGPGPHEVELTYVVGAHDENKKDDEGDNKKKKKKEYKMVFEMAKLNIVPHAIHLFLEQVEHGLWNNTYLYLNSPRIAKMGPLPVFDDDIAVETTKTANSNDDDKMKQYKKKLEETQLKNLKNLNVTLRPSLKPFCDAELDALQFPDYSHSFPHRPWTVAFAGRPGGPDIYINKRDNAHLHGPYGQENFYVLEEQGDACFAKITRGRETLENVLLEQPFHSEDDMLLHPIIITQAVLLTEKPQGNEPIHMLDDEDTSSSANEIPPPMEWVFGNTLSEALKEEEQTMIEIEEEKTQEGDELKIIESLAEQQVANEENNLGKEEEEQGNNNDRGEVDPMTIKK